MADSLSESETYVLEYINSEVSNLNFLFRVQHFLDSYNKRLEIFNLPDKQLIALNDAKELYFRSLNTNDYEMHNKINEIDPEENLRSDFIFLRQGQKFTQEFSLISFLVVGGNYEFKLRSRKIYDYIYDESIHTGSGIAEHRKIYLPKTVNGHRLFTGKIKAASTSLEIE